MARNKSGAFNRLLNFIGLVDDGDSRDTYGEEYQNGNYGRQAAYTPARSQRQASASRSTSSARQSQRRSLPEPRASRFDDRTARSRSTYDDRDPAGYDDYAEPRRTASRFDDGGDDYAPRQTARTSSRFSETQERRQSSSLPQARTQQQPRMRVSQRSRTVMYSLHSLEDCCEVIDQLIANNTVVLTMDELDGRLFQRAVDTLSGAVFALHASIRKASDKTYLVAPMSVEVNDAYDVERGFR
ncbi:MAG: cell division protein SepF [Clostridia bacterium]|nr:cell division protein SepF [Clostridia bacterium]